MSRFRAFLLNPNVHGIFALLAQIATVVPALAPWSTIISTVAATLTATAVVLPESGSLHQQDYANLSTVAATALKPPVETVQGRA